MKWLRDNGITIVGTVAHGSPYCYTYHYVNSYFWEDVPEYQNGAFYNYEYVKKDSKTIKIEKDKLSNYGLEYESSF